jgi:hypothetical protein
MNHGKKKFSGSREASKKRPPLGLVIALAAAGGMVIGSAGTYYFSKPLAAPNQAGSPAAGGMPHAQTITMPPQQQFTRPGLSHRRGSAGKVWSVEHGHWHDIPSRYDVNSRAGAVTTPAPAPLTVTPAATTTPAPAAAPAEKKE